jgi:hypothetical protein
MSIQYKSSTVVEVGGRAGSAKGAQSRVAKLTITQAVPPNVSWVYYLESGGGK